MRLQPYKFWSKTELSEHLSRVASRLNMGIDVKILIQKGMTDVKWNPMKDFNGCSVVQDLFHPCISCFVHDYLWITGQGGKDADYIFYKIMILEGTPKAMAWRRWFAVRVAWLFWFKWYYFFKRNLDPYSDEFSVLLNKFREEDARENG